jgi:hypothetical protein
VLNQFVRKIIAYNFPRKMWEKDGVGDFVVEDFDPEVMNTLSDVFSKLTSDGYMAPDMQEDLDHVRTKFGLAPKRAEEPPPAPEGNPLGMTVHPDTVDAQVTALEEKAGKDEPEDDDVPKFDL